MSTTATGMQTATGKAAPQKEKWQRTHHPISKNGQSASRQTWTSNERARPTDKSREREATGWRQHAIGEGAAETKTTRKWRRFIRYIKAMQDLRRSSREKETKKKRKESTTRHRSGSRSEIFSSIERAVWSASIACTHARAGGPDASNPIDPSACKRARADGTDTSHSSDSSFPGAGAHADGTRNSRSANCRAKAASDYFESVQITGLQKFGFCWFLEFQSFGMLVFGTLDFWILYQHNTDSQNPKFQKTKQSKLCKFQK